MTDRFGEVDWIGQAQVVIVEAANTAIQTLSQMTVDRNGSFDEPYAMPARTAEELKASMGEAANSGLTKPEVAMDDVADPATGDEGQAEEKEGWIL